MYKRSGSTELENGSPVKRGVDTDWQNPGLLNDLDADNARCNSLPFEPLVVKRCSTIRCASSGEYNDGRVSESPASGWTGGVDRSSMYSTVYAILEMC